jgi:hypothetical protein
MSNLAQSKSLSEALRAANKTGKFQASLFFSDWFRERGRSYFFLFRKNLSITNIQHSELQSLIRQHATFTNNGKLPSHITFHTTDEFNESINSIVSAFQEHGHFTEGDFDKIAELYWPLLEQSLVINMFYTSCALFLPPHIDIDLLRVCAESGYIHSCGYSLFIRNIEKAAVKHFYGALDQYLAKKPQIEGKVPFVPYAVEDFSASDGDVQYVKDDLRDGLNGVKVNVDKQYMQSAPHVAVSLASIVNEMKVKYKDRLIFYGSGPYRKYHPNSSETTMWLLRDHAINVNDSKKPSEHAYYICYHQIYYNESPFVLFDENKPAWVAHITIPHTLLAAMINITKPWERKSATVIGDPFAGTGTAWLESIKEPGAFCQCSDLNPMFPLLLRDNAMFFASPAATLSEYVVELRRLTEALKTPLNVADEASSEFLLPELNVFEPYRKVCKMLDQIVAGYDRPILSFDFDKSIVPKLESLSFYERLLFYLLLRAEIRFQNEFIRGVRDRDEAFVASAEYLREEIEAMESWRQRAQTSGVRVGSFAVFDGRYSKGCGIHFTQIEENARSLVNIDLIPVSDARDFPANSCDVIVTDPPYGVNTEEGLFELADLYNSVMVKLVEAVKDEGHLVICLPSRSYSGRPLPFCASRKIVVQQVLRAAASMGREVYSPSRSALAILAPPYYWESKALRRTILHFRIRTKPI